jgi:drug/metabolite transporter (DMT)-like permease
LNARPAAGGAASAGVLAAWALVFNAFTWGVSWWPFRQLEARGLHPLWATAVTYAIATVALALWRPAALRELLRTPSLWVLVAASGCTNAAFNWGVTTGDVVRVVLLFYLMPLWALLLARLLLGERLGARALLRVAIALAGALIVLWPEHGGWPLPRQRADWLGVIGGFAFALNNVMLRHQAHRGEIARALAMFGGGASVAGLLALAVAAGTPPLAPAAALQGWLPGALGLAAWFMVSNLALQYGASRLRATTTAVVMVSEVLFASVSAIALGAATWTAQVALGGLLILAAALMAAWGEKS